MKRLRLALLFLVITCLTVGTFNVLASRQQPLGEDVYYWYEGRRIQLNSTDQDWIIGLRDVNDNKVDQALSQLSNLGITALNISTKRRAIYTDTRAINSQNIESIRAIDNVISFRPRYTVPGFEKMISVPDEALVTFTSPIPLDRIQRFGERFNMVPDSLWTSFPAEIVLYRWQGDNTQTLASVIDQMRQSSLVIAAEPNLGNTIILYQTSPNDPVWNRQWNFILARLPEAWDEVYDRSEYSPVKIAIIDTWTFYDHGDLNAVSEFHYVPGFPESPDYRLYGVESHGTPVAGIAGAITNNQFNVAGAAGGWAGDNKPPVDLILIDNIGNEPEHGVYDQPYFDDIALALGKAVALGADVINCSWGIGLESTTVDSKINQVVVSGRDNHKGCVVVFAAGNSHNSPISEPSDHPKVIAVGATDSCEVRWVYSMFDAVGGPQELDLVAPSGWDKTTEDIFTPYGQVGMYVPSTGVSGDGSPSYPETHYRFGGTSAAAPMVSGVVALILSIRPDIPSHEVREVLISSAKKIQGGQRYRDGDPNETYSYTNGYNRFVGYGQLDAYQAIDVATSWYPKIIEGLSANQPIKNPPSAPTCWWKEDPLAKITRPPSGPTYYVRLSWDRPGNNPPYNYLIERSEDGEYYSPRYWAAGDYNCFVDSGLEEGERYWYTVAEYWNAGGSARVGTRSDPVMVDVPDGEGAGVNVSEDIKFGIDSAWPNPFNSQSVIKYGLDKQYNNVQLQIFNVRGQEVFRKFNLNTNAGYHVVRWDGKNNQGLPIATGIYLVRMRADNNVSTIRITLIR